MILLTIFSNIYKVLTAIIKILTKNCYFHPLYFYEFMIKTEYIRKNLYI
jgi:hypothetical protein